MQLVFLPVQTSGNSEIGIAPSRNFSSAMANSGIQWKPSMQRGRQSWSEDSKNQSIIQPRGKNKMPTPIRQDDPEEDLPLEEGATMAVEMKGESCQSHRKMAAWATDLMTEFLDWTQADYRDMVLRGCEVDPTLCGKMIDRLSRTQCLSRVFHPPKGWVDKLLASSDPATINRLEQMMAVKLSDIRVSIFGDSSLSLDRKVGDKWEKTDPRSQLEQVAVPGLHCDNFVVLRGRGIQQLRISVELAAAASLISDRKVWIVMWTLNDFFRPA